MLHHNPSFPAFSLSPTSFSSFSSTSTLSIYSTSSSFIPASVSPPYSSSSTSKPTPFVVCASSVAPALSSTIAQAASSSAKEPILLRCVKGHQVERPPVWLMRQAGRYMKDFREYSDKYPFRERSETPEIAIELSLQPWRSFGVDGVIMFSDILTPLPAIGIDFDIVKGKGPIITTQINSQVDAEKILPVTEFDPHSKLAFIKTILGSLRSEIKGKGPALLGFVGLPWTLTAYTIEGGSSKEIKKTKKMMFTEPSIVKTILQKTTDMIGEYACYQIDSGAEIIQLFDSWAHHLSPQQYAEFSIPYTQQVINKIRQKHPDVPILFFPNGCAGKLELIRDTLFNYDMLSLDWSVRMDDARKILGPNIMVQGNIDPCALFGSQTYIRNAIIDCVQQAGPKGHVLNLGHGVLQGTPEENVALFCQTAFDLEYPISR